MLIYPLLIKNHSITLKVREIKEKLTFLDNAKLSLLKDLEINVKRIADFKMTKLN